MAKNKRTPDAVKNSGKGLSYQEQLAEIKATLPNAQKNGENNLTFSGIFEAYLSSLPDLEGSGNDIKRFKNYIEEDFGDIVPSEVVPDDIEKFRLKLQNKLLIKPTTQRHVLELLQRLANYAFEKKFCPGLSFEIQIPTVENLKTGNNPVLKEKVKKEPVIRNDFLSKLLNLQQDGNEAISAPSKWLKEEPLLKIETPIDNDINDLVENMLIGKNGNNTARWHFFIGSPGNGKSAAIGEICRKLVDKYNCKIVDGDGVPILDLDEKTIPYEIKIIEKLGNNDVSSAMIIQDASVVRKAWAKDVDPSKDLLKSVESAYEKGISLLVCTNRGVIEKAIRENALDKNYNEKIWFKSLNQVNKEGSELRNEPWEFDVDEPFKKYILKASYLDNSSLLNETKTFDNLIKEATKESHWGTCHNCEESTLCPFLANRNWLDDEDTRGNFLSIMSRAEVFSGQIIVFREALALISFLLAGCPIDYEDITPCTWVKQKARAKDIFALAMRRIYMSMFYSFSSYGLDFAKRLRTSQKQTFKSIANVMEKNSDSWHHLNHISDQDDIPSSDVGVPRLLGPEGVMKEIDAYNEGLDQEFLDNWDSDNYEEYLGNNTKHFTEIEKVCVQTWINIEKCIESSTSLDSPKCYQNLRRWSSNFLLHFGILIEGKTSWADELENFVQVLTVLKTKRENRTPDQKKIIRDANSELGKLLTINAGGIQSDTIELSENVRLKGDWLGKLKPEIDNDAVSKGPLINVKFLDTKTTLSARAFIWQKRHTVLNLDPSCFPKDFFIGMLDARKIAASSKENSYAFQDGGVNLLIKDNTGKYFNLDRYEWEVEILDE